MSIVLQGRRHVPRIECMQVGQILLKGHDALSFFGVRAAGNLPTSQGAPVGIHVVTFSARSQRAICAPA
jgi:hypothetical protein